MEGPAAPNEQEVSHSALNAAVRADRRRGQGSGRRTKGTISSMVKPANEGLYKCVLSGCEQPCTRLSIDQPRRMSINMGVGFGLFEDFRKVN